MEKKNLNIEVIKDMIPASHRPNRIGSFMIFVPFVFLWVVCSFEDGAFSPSAFVCSGICIAPISFLLAYFLLDQKRVFRAINRLDFYLDEDICSDKKYRDDGEGLKEYFLFFSKHGKYRDPLGRVSENTEVGDEVYVLRIPGSRRIKFVFSKKLWELETSLFEKKADRYFPKK